MKLLLALLALTFSAIAQTRIVDTLGGSGSCTLSWPTFTQPTGNIVERGSLRVAIPVGGAVNLRLQANADAVPPGSYYTWRCKLNNAQQSNEYWTIPTSGSNLAISSVRIATGTPPATGGSGGGTPVTFADGQTPIGTINGTNTVFSLSAVPIGLRLVVNGLDQASPADYSLSGTTLTFTQAPVSGSRILAWFRTNNGTSGASFVDGETPTGTVNGTNAVFTLAFTPSPVASLQLALNGQVLASGSDFTLAGSTITFAAAPSSGGVLRANYRR
jgi:stress response protein SCP2